MNHRFADSSHDFDAVRVGPDGEPGGSIHVDIAAADAAMLSAATRGDQVIDADDAELTARLHSLSQEHRDLDSAIEALRALPGHDQIQLARLKKRKLRLRDEIALVHDLLVPDIIA